MIDNSRKTRAEMSELWNRETKFDEADDVYNNGANNLYPNEVERVILNSPTAFRSSVMMAKYISGQGVEGVPDDLIVNKQKGYVLHDIVKAMASSIAIQNGFFLHVGYTIDGEKYVPNKLTVLDYVRCRISKEDDNEYPNKVYVGDWEAESAVARLMREHDKWRGTDKAKKKIWYYPFNPDKKVIEAQIQADALENNVEGAAEMIKNYRGQVLYVNLTPNYKYALSKFNVVYNDMDTEYRMSLYSNSMVRSGFLGKTAILTQGLDKDTADQVAGDLPTWMGAENSQLLYHIDVVRTDDLDKVMKIIQLESQYDDDMFNNTEKRIRRNITGAANNIPEPLIYAADGALFGTSGDTYQGMKEFYNEQTQEERHIIERTLLRLGYDIKIITFEDENVDEEETEELEKGAEPAPNQEEEEAPDYEEEEEEEERPPLKKVAP